MNNAITQAVNAESNSIKSEISTTYVTKNALTGYSTTEAMNNAITQAITKESNSIKLEVSGTYATKNDINNLQIGGVNRFIKSTVTPNKYITATGIITDGGNYWDLTDYIDVSKWKNYVASGWTNLGNAPATCFYDSNKKFISGVADKSTGVRGSLPVPSNAAYMRFSFAHVDTNKLKIEKGTKATDYSPAPEDIDVKFNNYATTASLEAYIKKDPTSGELKSAIEAIADDITLNASGTINISGNKSVNINGDLFTLTTTNTTISADGTITCKKLNAKGSTIGGYTINDYTLVGEQVGISSKSGYGWAFWAGSDTPENSVFKVGHDGSLYAKSAHITGGDIDINTSTLSTSAIKLNYGSRHARMSPYQISYTSDEYESFMDADGFAILDKSGNSISELRDKSLMLNQGDCYVYGYYYISSGGAWVELSEWIKQKLGI